MEEIVEGGCESEKELPLEYCEMDISENVKDSVREYMDRFTPMNS